jgi:outer membrane immunogenic protein
MHKTISAAGVLLIAVGTTSVMAADLPSRKSPPVPLAPPVINWTGGYVGGQVGVQWGDTSWNRFNSSNNNLIASEIPYATNGVVGGGHIGYNYQANQFVFGLEGDFEGTNFKGNGVSTANTAANTLQADYEASIRARAGIAWEHLLVYITSGGAYENFHLAAQNPPGVSYATQRFGRIG